MKKILYVDFVCNTYGHKRFNQEIIKCLSRISSVDVLSQKNWYSDMGQEVRIIELSFERYPEGRLLGRLSSLSIMRRAALLDREKVYDFIIVASYENVSFKIGSYYFRGLDKVYIMHHNDLDRIRGRRINEIIFKSFAKSVNHIVFEDFIKGYLCNKYEISADTVIVIPHPLNEVHLKTDKEFDAIGISNSNNEEFIHQIIDVEMKTEILKKNKKKMLLRSKTQSYDDGYLKVIVGYLNDDEYYSLIIRSQAVIMPFPDTFENRSSGTLVDALSNNIRIYGTDIPVVASYSHKYPLICQKFSDIDELIELISHQKDIVNLNSFADFQKEHSSENITRLFKRHLKIE